MHNISILQENSTYFIVVLTWEEVVPVVDFIHRVWVEKNIHSASMALQEDVLRPACRTDKETLGIVISI